ncbi:uncharacterized protein DUF2550 [Sediminihabitans luteus]|uniref:Uncharacterized protein DUF2550 n=1 Tax=Sediminihabitans luteus TaxID=1138585 RepID=A0A2M9CDR4_9CELL|nr:DUF2550 domain-containing protein [Sediminihabitans luteus]PJJ70071.1 uncharacterized protein DUF2550 [Sediminihabitans luteus]GIJ00145.1 hypothetical protein Slu03_25220 [Sediminihabitans luteus]
MTPVAWTAVVLVAVVLVAVVLGAVRLRGLNRRLGSFECGLRAGGSRTGWVAGVAVYGAGRIDWWRYWSVSVRPARVWRREEVLVKGRVPLDSVGQQDQYLVQCTCAGEELELVMSTEAYAGLTAWLEAAPPSVRGLVV